MNREWHNSSRNNYGWIASEILPCHQEMMRQRFKAAFGRPPGTRKRAQCNTKLNQANAVLEKNVWILKTQAHQYLSTASTRAAFGRPPQTNANTTRRLPKNSNNKPKVSQKWTNGGQKGAQSEARASPKHPLSDRVEKVRKKEASPDQIWSQSSSKIDQNTIQKIN